MNLCCRFSTKRMSAVCFNAEVFLNLPRKSPKARVRRFNSRQFTKPIPFSADKSKFNGTKVESSKT